jgi:L,D-transpeptidase YcbB
MAERGMRQLRIPRAFLGLALLAVVMPATAAQGQQQSISSAIRKQADGKLKKFYAARGNKPLWLQNGRFAPHAEVLLGMMAKASLDGLNPDDYRVSKIRAALFEGNMGSPQAMARAELMLSEQFARYVDDMREPGDVGMRWLDPSLVPKSRKADAILRAATYAPSFADYVSKMAWMSPHYVTQRRLLARAVAVNASPNTLARLELNLERARLLPGPWVHHIVVDAASGRLWYYQAGKEAGTMRVVVGKPQSPTPMLAGMLQYAILNPYWNIPTDLAQTIVAPKVLAGRSLSSMRMEALSDWSTGATKLDPKSIDWRAVASGAQQLRIRELPGPANSMGRAKFMFPNDSGIYLHDTPQRDLLTKPKRHFSNGCVRLEDAPRLGQWLLGRSIVAKGASPEQAVPLRVPMPVYLTYLTAIEGKNGVVFLDDVYGRDGVL